MSAQPAEAIGLVGRDVELALVDRFFSLGQEAPAALVIAGDAGMGKSVLLRVVIDHARSLGWRVLVARPAEAETAYGYAALADLLRPGRDVFGPGLPLPLRQAMETAVFFESTAGAIDSQLVATATAHALERLAADGELLVAIDDAQWLDPDSVRAIAYAANRAPSGVVFAVAHRAEEGALPPLGLERSIAADRLVRIVPTPLSLAGIHHLLRTSLGLDVPRPLLLRIAEASGGNPFAAIELGRAIDDSRAMPGELTRLPVPEAVRALVAQRVDRLTEGARQVALLVALGGRLSLGHLEQVVGPDLAVWLDEAEAAGVLDEDGGAVRPAHPLIATAVEAMATDSARRDGHERLAAHASDPEVRAHHLARLPNLGSDRLATIEAGAQAAIERGAPASAAQLLGVAAGLTFPDDANALRRRRVREALAWLAAGDALTSRSIAEEVIAIAGAQERVEVVTDLSDIAWADGTMEREAARLRTVLANASDLDRRLAIQARTALVAFEVTIAPDLAIEDADAGLALVDEVDDPGRAGSLRINREMAAGLAGRGVDWQNLERGIELERRALSQGGGLSSPPLVMFTMSDLLDRARERFEEEDLWYAARGEVGWRAERRSQLALLELRAGHVERAATLADEAWQSLERVSAEGGWPLVYAWRSLIDAHRGVHARAMTTVDGLRAAVPEKEGIWRAIIESVAAFVAWAVGDDDAALEATVTERRILESIGVRDLLADRTEPFLAEIYAARGATVAAREELDRLEQRHATFPRAWTAAALPRTRAVIAAAEGDLHSAIAAVPAPDAGSSALPFEAAWTLLVRGRLLRRIRERREAATALAEARSTFDRIGATPWVLRADDELRRVGLRHRAPDDLTEGELTIARLAARGLTTQQVAKAAFVSPKTVEANLTRIYRKLDIGSRAELGAAMRDREG
jgi:DNA-binding CsgD family transcriptional regulator